MRRSRAWGRQTPVSLLYLQDYMFKISDMFRAEDRGSFDPTVNCFIFTRC